MIAENLAAVRAKIAAAANGREVTLIAVSKTHPVESIEAAYAVGQRDFGENYAQELVTKAESLSARCPELRWHYIGRLQKNKINGLLPHVFAWHTIDSPETAAALLKRVPNARGLLQVNVGGEAQKGGVPPTEVAGVIGAFPFVGLMTIPPADGDATPYFAALAKLRDAHLPKGWLSMGMSHDFAQAIAAGATHVRVGTAIFGARP